MLTRLVHRGPDGEGSRRVGDSWLGHRRLAIVDLEHGGAAGARRLDPQRSDHEAALHLFDDEGVDAFERLWGEFAFAIAADDGRFVATRDTLGVAPLYWARRDDTVLFASELKAFDEDWRGEVEPFPPGHTWTPQEGLRAWRPSPTAVPVLMRSLARTRSRRNGCSRRSGTR